MKILLQLALLAFAGMLYSQDTPIPIDIPEPKPEEREVFKVVEQMPKFPGCSEMEGSENEKMECSRDKLIQYIYQNLKYPKEAKENGTEGHAVLQFIVTKEGSIEEVNVVRDPGDGCGEAAKNLVLSMNDFVERWTPGKQRGRPVHVLYTLPVKFKLDKDKSKNSRKTKRIRSKKKWR